MMFNGNSCNDQISVDLTRPASAPPPPSGVGARCGGTAFSRVPVLSVLFVAALAFAASSQTGPLSLDQCIDMALRSNLTLEIAAERIAERDAAIEEAGVANMPRISANASYTYLVPGITGALKGKQSVPAGVDLPDPYEPGFRRLTNASVDYKVSPHVLNAGISASYVLYSGGRIQNAQRIASQSRTMSEWQKRSAEREVRRDVTKAYYQALAVDKNIMALDSAIALMEVTINDMNNLVEVGMLGEHEVLLMEVELSNLRLSRQQVITGAQSAYDYLAMLIGLPVNTSFTLINDLQSPQSFGLPELTSLQSRAVEASTDIKALEEQLSIIETSIAITDAANLPTVVAAAGYGGSHQGRVLKPVKDDWKWDNQATLSLVAQWDIWDGNAKRHQRSQARSQKRQLELTIDNIKTGLDMGVKTSAASLRDAYAAIETCRKSIAQAKRSYEISYDKFQQGMLASSELLRAHNSVLQSEIAYYSAISTFYARQADLDYLVNE